MKASRVLSMLLLVLGITFTSCEKEPEPIPVTGITLDSSSMTLTEGESAILKATISPSNADNQGVIWSSSNSSVASVSNGTVTAVTAGTAIITAKSDDGGKTATCNVTVNSKIVAVTGVSLDKSSLELTEGDEYTLVATVQPENASNKTVSWSSNDSSIASVDDGKVKAIKPGKTSISVKTDDGNKIATCEITVKERIYPVESISLDKANLELTEGDEATLTATIKPENASNKQVTWKSEDETIATVDDGKVKAIKPGKTSISVKTDDGNKIATCSVKVNERIYHVESVSLDKASLELTEGDEYTLVATVFPENATDKSISWTSDNDKVATVNDGKVTAVGSGNATITVQTVDGGKTATCNITVKKVVPEGAVDLGLSVFWATCNVGASSPEEYGGLYQWAGTEDVSNSVLNWNNCPYHIGPKENTGWTKYIPLSRPTFWSGAGNPDDKTELDPQDDVAFIALGGGWRTPTYNEWNELQDYCSWIWTDDYKGTGIAGMIVTSKVPGYTDKSIFLPAAGSCDKDGLRFRSVYGNYWASSSGNKQQPAFADGLSFNMGEIVGTCSYRYYGQSVRPVSK